ncbi:MAG TPA: hypothetical protein VFI27_13015 [candidate division Zixibacteria bacterium]|nr:hypothetical protein [candidate division Zixibacteria bacterium]
MTTNLELAQGLAEAGYLSDADLEAAAIILQDALVIEEAEEIEGLALIDKAEQKENVLNAELLADAAVAFQDPEMEAGAQEMIDDAFVAVIEDKMIIEEVEAVIADAYVDAAAALLAAELIDEANAEAVAVMLAEARIADEEDEV